MMNLYRTMCFRDIYKDRQYRLVFDNNRHYLIIFDNYTKTYSRTLFGVSEILDHLAENIGTEKFREVEQFIFENI